MIVVSKGYSQGDYKEVVVLHELWECIGVKKPDYVQAELGSHIDSLLWDCPIVCHFTVSGVEYCVDQELKNAYNWDKDEALEIAKKLIKEDFTGDEKGIILEFLNEAFKADLKYK